MSEEEDRIPSFVSLMSIVRTRFDEMTDALYAIIATILVLEIHIPELGNPNSSAELWASLVSLLPKFLMWIVSFLTVMGIWAENHRFNKTLSSLPNEVFSASIFMLMSLTLIPFATGLMGSYYKNPLAVASFGIVMMFYKLFFTILHITVSQNKKIITSNFGVGLYKDAVFKIFLMGPVFYFLSALSVLIHPYVAMFLYYVGALIVPFFYWFFHFKKYTFPDEDLGDMHPKLKRFNEHRNMHNHHS